MDESSIMDLMDMTHPLISGQGFSSFFCQIFAILNDFPKWSIADLWKIIIIYGKNLAKNEENPLSTFGY